MTFVKSLGVSNTADSRGTVNVLKKKQLKDNLVCSTYQNKTLFQVYK